MSISKHRPFSHVTTLAAMTLFGAASNLPASAADGLLSTHRIPAALANEAVEAAVAACAAQGYHESAVLVDVHGSVTVSLVG